MPAPEDAPLSPNQKSMLDLALGCDLKVSNAPQHPAIRARHKAIVTQNQAVDYIREVESRIHSRRKFRSLGAGLVKQTAVQAPQKTEPINTGVLASFALFGLLALMIVAAWFAPAGLNLILVTALMIMVLIVLGMSITNRPMGVLINERNLMSLSRFQMAIWTVLILASYFTFAMVRIKAMASGVLNGHIVTDPLSIQIDWHLWALLGVSTTSLVASPLILGTKKNKEPDPAVPQKTAQSVNEAEVEIVANKQGTLYANSKILDACLTDLFQGDELANTAQIDLAKVQMFYFTIIAAICFFAMVIRILMNGDSALGELPLLPDGLVAVLGISHAGYLASKSIDHTKTQQ